MTTQTATTTETPEPSAPIVADQAPVESPPSVSAAPPAAPVAAAPEPTSPAPAAPAPVIDPKLQEYIASLERTNRETQARLNQEAAVTQIARRQEALVADGLAPERAQAIATEIVQATQQAQTQVAEMRAKVLYAAQLADTHKVSVASLMQYDTPDAMRQAVERLASEGSKEAELARLREENVRLKKGQVPAQNFDSGRGQEYSGGADYMAKLRSGKPLPTSREIDEDTAQFLRARGLT